MWGCWVLSPAPQEANPAQSTQKLNEGRKVQPRLSVAIGAFLAGRMLTSEAFPCLPCLPWSDCCSFQFVVHCLQPVHLLIVDFVLGLLGTEVLN